MLELWRKKLKKTVIFDPSILNQLDKAHPCYTDNVLSFKNIINNQSHVICPQNNTLMFDPIPRNGA